MYSGYNWNTPADENCDNCGRSFEHSLNHRSLLYWEIHDEGSYAATQWFHASPMTLTDSTDPQNTTQDIEMYIRGSRCISSIPVVGELRFSTK